MKTKLNYTVRETTAPGEASPSIVPVIVERVQPTSLESVVENCIDRGLIAGLKPTAAAGIADGVARQLANEFRQGRGVKFGQFFYGRPYLSGSVGPNGSLTDKNAINVRLYKGDAFKLTLDDFQMTFDGAGDAVKVDSIFGDTSDAGGNTRGQIVAGSPIVINGRNLWSVGDTNRVTFNAEGEEPVVVNQMTTQSSELLTFACPAGLVANTRYAVTVSRTDINGTTRMNTGKFVLVVPAATPPGPVGPQPEIDQINGQTVTEVTPVVDTSVVRIVGSNFTGASLKVSYDDGQGGTEEHAITLDAQSDAGTLVTNDDWYQEAGLSTNSKSITFTVTTPNGSTTAQASYQPE